MPNTVLSITIPEALAQEAAELLCGYYGLDVTPANAKVAATKVLQERLTQLRQRKALSSTQPVTGLT